MYSVKYKNMTFDIHKISHKFRRACVVSQFVFPHKIAMTTRYGLVQKARTQRHTKLHRFCRCPFTPVLNWSTVPNALCTSTELAYRAKRNIVIEYQSKTPEQGLQKLSFQQLLPKNDATSYQVTNTGTKIVLHEYKRQYQIN